MRLRTLRLGILAGLNCLGLIAQISNGTSPAGARERIGRHHAGPIRDKTERTKGLADSTNWSGYAVLGSSFTSAAGSWVVPAAVCYAVSGDQYSSFWVGLDGYESNTVEQIGTDSDCVGTTPIYYAWYEFYPRNAFEILTVPVAPGNIISASVTYNAGEFTVTISNKSTGQSFSKNATVPGAARTSAEWIVEAPCCTKRPRDGILPLADFVMVGLGRDFSGQPGTNDAADSAINGPIGSFGAANIEQITKVGSSTSPQTSTCSALTPDGTSFSCVWAP